MRGTAGWCARRSTERAPDPNKSPLSGSFAVRSMPIKRICRVWWRSWRPYCGFRAADLPLDGSPRRITRHGAQRPSSMILASSSSAYRRGRGSCRRTNPTKSGSVAIRNSRTPPRRRLARCSDAPGTRSTRPRGTGPGFRPAGLRLSVVTHKSGHRHGPFGARPQPAGDPAGVEPRPVGAAAPGGRSAPPVGRPASRSYPAVVLSPQPVAAGRRRRWWPGAHDPGEPLEG
jgi:hypothetical protein